MSAPTSGGSAFWSHIVRCWVALPRVSLHNVNEVWLLALAKWRNHWFARNGVTSRHCSTEFQRLTHSSPNTFANSVPSYWLLVSHGLACLNNCHWVLTQLSVFPVDVHLGLHWLTVACRRGFCYQSHSESHDGRWLFAGTSPEGGSIRGETLVCLGQSLRTQRHTRTHDIRPIIGLPCARLTSTLRSQYSGLAKAKKINPRLTALHCACLMCCFAI